MQCIPSEFCFSSVVSVWFKFVVSDLCLMILMSKMYDVYAYQYKRNIALMSYKLNLYCLAFVNLYENR